MLVLSRKVGEQIVIDGRVVLTINRVMGQRVSLGIEAPEKVQVLRGELAERPAPRQVADVEDLLPISPQPKRRRVLAR